MTANTSGHIERDRESHQSVGRRFLRIRQVQERTGRSRSAIYADIQIGVFPPPIRLGARAVAWDSIEIDAWMDARVAASRATA